MTHTLHLSCLNCTTSWSYWHLHISISDLERIGRAAAAATGPHRSPDRDAAYEFVCPRVSTLVNGLYDVMNQQWDKAHARSFLASMFQLAMEVASEAARSFDTITARWKRDGMVCYIW